MSHELFYNRFPQIAERETRTIIVSGPELGVPPGTYHVYEYYCTDDECDCRQVYLHIVNHATQQHEAVISYGWEPIDFYKNWNFGNLGDMLRDFKGPALGTMMRQGRYANEWLKYVSSWLKSDTDYVKRLERHYKLFKSKLSVGQ